MAGAGAVSAAPQPPRGAGTPRNGARRESLRIGFMDAPPSPQRIRAGAALRLSADEVDRAEAGRGHGIELVVVGRYQSAILPESRSHREAVRQRETAELGFEISS